MSKFNLKDKQIDKLFKIIEDAEEKIESIKAKINRPDITQEKVDAAFKEIIQIQNLMKRNFDLELLKMIKESEI